MNGCNRRLLHPVVIASEKTYIKWPHASGRCPLLPPQAGMDRLDVVMIQKQQHCVLTILVDKTWFHTYQVCRGDKRESNEVFPPKPPTPRSCTIKPYVYED